MSGDKEDNTQSLENIEAEQAVLGCIMLNNDVFEKVSRVTRAEHFSGELHQRIFECLARIIADGRAATPISAKTYLGDYDIGEGLMLSKYLIRLVTNAPAPINSVDYAQIIADLHARRRLVDSAAEMTEYANDAPIGVRPAQIAASAIERLDELVREADFRNYRTTAGQSGTMALERAQDAQRGGKIPGVKTGLVALDNILGTLKPGALVVGAGRPGMGKAQPLNALIRTLDAWVPMGDISIGTAIASIDGEPSFVTGITPQGRKAVYRVGFSDGRSTEVCADHLWEVKYRDWSAPRVLSTHQIAEKLLRKRYVGRVSIPMINGSIGDSIIRENLPLHPYLLGALLGNGCFRQDTIRFSGMDEPTLQRIRETVPDGVYLRKSSKYEYRFVASLGGKNPLTAEIRKMGLYWKGSPQKFIPQQYMIASTGARLEILRGLMDTDGWVEKAGSAKYATASPLLCDNVIELARSLGFWAKFAVKPAYVRGGKHDGRKMDSYSITITGQNISDIFTLPRKKERLANRTWFRALTIKSVEFQRYDECQCISVSHPSKLYVTDQYVVTHNSAWLYEVALNVALQDPAQVSFLWSGEMPGVEVSQRMLSSLVHREFNIRVPYNLIPEGRVNLDQLERLWEAQRILDPLQIEIDAQPGLSITQIFVRARRLKQRAVAAGKRLALVGIDHLQIVKAGDGRASRTEQIEQISNTAKIMAMELDCPVIALSQLSREIENRPLKDRRPQAHDLRGSGSIEQDADVILGMFREAEYLLKLPERTAEQETRLQSVRNDLEIGVMKNRGGRTGNARLRISIGTNYISDRDADLQHSMVDEPAEELF